MAKTREGGRIQNFPTGDGDDCRAGTFTLILTAKTFHRSTWGIGVRIEDNILVTESGCEVLTAAVPKTIDEIEKLMA